MSRIKWTDVTPWQQSGDVGGIPMFGIVATRNGVVLATSLPGMDHKVKLDKTEDAFDTLQRIAEAWLADFVAGLGAEFKERVS